MEQTFAAIGIVLIILAFICLVLIAMAGRTLDSILDVLKEILFYLKK